MISLRLTVPDSEHDRLLAELWDADTSGVTEAPGELLAFFAEDDRSAGLLDRFRLYAPVLRHEQERDWASESLARWTSFPVGERFYLVPEWRNDPAPCGRVRLRTHPGLACGTGAHPCTQLCLIALERYLAPGHSLLDVGTGAGILSQAGLLLGAGSATACDVDHESVLVARRNTAIDPVRPRLFTGSVNALRSESFDLILANIHAVAAKQLASEFERVSRGRIIVSGFPSSETEAVVAAYSHSLLDVLRLDGWDCAVFNC